MKELWAIKIPGGEYLGVDQWFVKTIEDAEWFVSRDDAKKVAHGDRVVSVDAERERIANRRAA